MASGPLERDVAKRTMYLTAAAAAAERARAQRTDAADKTRETGAEKKKKNHGIADAPALPEPTV